MSRQVRTATMSTSPVLILLGGDIPCRVPCKEKGESRLLRRPHYLVCTSLTTMSDVGRVIWKSSYSLFFGLIIFFSLPATTLAFNVSISAPTQCSPFNITWDDSVSLFNLYILPFNDIPVVADDQSLIHDNITKTYNYTVNELPLKNGTQFIVVLDYGSGARLSSPLLIHNFRVLTFWPMSF